MIEVRNIAIAMVTLATAVSCTQDASSPTGGTGNVQIFVVPEETITGGLEPGTEAENVQDGWSIRYRRYLVAVGNFAARRSDTGDTIQDTAVHILDLVAAPSSGYVIGELRDVPAARFDKFGYDVPNAKLGAKPIAPTSQADADFMIQNGYSVYYEGYGEKEGRKISFKWGFRSGTSFQDCESPDGIPGFAVPAGGTVQIKPTLHGDHQYFDNVTQGVELTKRYAAWLDVCDANRNLDLTLDELKECNAATALPSVTYNLTGVADEDGDGKISVYDYVSSQMRTFGDFQGDGECPTRTRLP